MQLANRVTAVQPSPTLAITAKAKAMKAAGEDILSLAAGEPDFATPEPIRKACYEAIEAGHTGYTASAGIPQLRDMLRTYYADQLGLEYADDQVVVCVGAKQALYNAMQAVLNPADKAVIQTPYWVSYPAQVTLAGAKSILLPMASNSFGLNREELTRLDDPSIRMIVLNSPSNPSGHVLGAEELDAVAQLAKRLDLVILTDDIYDKLVYDGLKVEHMLVRHPDLRDRTVVINGLSKTFAMTGWRLGWALGPQAIISAMRKIQDQSTSNAVTFVQHAALAALAAPEDLTSHMLSEFSRRRTKIVSLLNRLDGVACQAPQGSFYVFASFHGLLGRKLDGRELQSGLQLAECLLENEKIAVIPGEAFGAPGYLRFSFACSMETIEKAISRIERWIARLD